ncbi:hypothetical protein SDC64_05350 [Acinetobacter haemolyticus]|uniref:hypothetical protein n=1 Tax=Acinetobacter haemolyticus TaxID=29430 RepID=UPI002A6B24EC|nr:hypothetical protein [Acinetobacter haemolyticus]WPO68354.1 hypothetical protein SDC64_05350 [Acinetobacter haemolyticus]
MNSVYSYSQIHREIYNVITFYILRLKKNYSTADELQQLDYFKDSAVFFEFLMVVYSHGDSLKGNKRHELWDRLLRLFNEKGWRPSEEKLHLGFLERRGYEKDSLQYKFYYSPQCSEFLDNICHRTSDLLGVIIDRSSHEVKVIPSDRDLNLLESMLKPYVENLMPSPDKNERTRQVILEKFEQAFKNNIHLKIVCMDVEHFSPKQTDKAPSWQSIKGLRKRREFENKVSIAHPELSFFIRKSEYAGNGKFKYLYIFVFNQQALLTPKTYYESIKCIWQEIDSEAQPGSIEFLNPLLTKLQMSLGVIEEDTWSFEIFVRGILNYIFKIEDYIHIVRSSSTDKDMFIGRIEYLEPRSFENINEIKKDIRRKRSPRAIAHRNGMIISEYDWEKKLKLTKPLIEQSKDIKLSYNFLLLDEYATEQQSLGELLYKIDLIVLCAFKWKAPVFGVKQEDSVEVKYLNEIGKVIVEIDKAYKFKRQELIQKAEYLGLRVGLFVIIFEYLGALENSNGLIPNEVNRYYFYNTLVEEINLIYLKPINELVGYLQNRIDEFRAKQSTSYAMYREDGAEPEFFSILLKKISRLLEQKINRSAKSDLTLKDWYSTQIRSRQNSYENLVRYSRQCRSDQTKDIEVDIEFALTNDSKMDINFFHEVLTKGIDLFSRTDFAKEAIRGYWGVWESISFQNQQCDAHVRLIFFMDQRYVARQEELHDELNKALEKAIASPYKNLDKANEIKFNFKEYLCFQALGEELLYNPVSDRKKTAKEREKRLHMGFYLALHRDLYWLPSDLILKQRVIRGRENYKARRKSSKPKALK